jgi:hypothetical protein
MCLLLAVSTAASAARTVTSLNGTWQLAESIGMEQMPAAYPHTAPVPGLAHSAVPPLVNIDAFDSREYIQTSIREKKRNRPASRTLACRGRTATSSGTSGSFWRR